jgi:hypothetical protein
MPFSFFNTLPIIFVTRGSNVFVATLDAKKAFGRIIHVKLFSIVLEIGVLGRLINVILDWYGKNISAVEWH